MSGVIARVIYCGRQVRFRLKTYRSGVDEGENHIYGDFCGLDKDRFLCAKNAERPYFSYFSSNGEEGIPAIFSLR